MKKLLKKLEEQYQTVEFKGKVYEGKRDCGKRYDQLFPYIKPHDVIMDIGSSLGYYGIRLARTFPDCLVVSFESDPHMVEIQKKILKSEGLYNVIVCQHRLTPEDLGKWVQHVDLFDVILSLSVLHHYPVKGLPTVINALTQMAPLMIGEIPEPDEDKACGQDTLEECWKLIGKVEEIATNPSHLGEYIRKLWTKRSHPQRYALDAFFGVSHPDRHRFDVQDNMINKKHIIKGLNVWNLLHYNIKWPLPNWWQAQAKAAYELESKSDVRPWNLLVTSSGLKAIDFVTEFPKGDQAEFKQMDMINLYNLFKSMNKEKYAK